MMSQTDYEYILTIIAFILAIIAIELTVIVVVLCQTAFESRKMNDERIKELQDFRQQAAQEAILKDYFDKQHFAYHLKEVFDKHEKQS